MINLLDLRLNIYLSPDRVHSLFHFWVRGLEIATHWSVNQMYEELVTSRHYLLMKSMICANRYKAR